MSKLFYSETGRIVHLINEELSSRRHARKILHLPDKITSGGVLYIYGKHHPGCKVPLQVVVNETTFVIKPDGLDYFHWFSLSLDRAHLQPGGNIIEFWSDNIGMDSWMLGIEGAVSNPDSALSLDSGRTWQNERMGIYHCLSGEYVVRLRLNDESLCDPEPPPLVWETPDCPLFEELRKIIPSDIQNIQEPWERSCALNSWVSSQWDYRNERNGIEYTPWDPFTILSWGKKAHGQVKQNPITMCVHYSIVFSCGALALGIPSRNICCRSAQGYTGHFVSEVWIEKWHKWCQIDANCDVVYIKDGIPLSVGELYTERDKLADWAVKGTGYDRLSSNLQQFATESCFSGKVFENLAVWPRNDYLTHPEFTPTAHGTGVYLETDWLWARTDTNEILGMFPYCLELKELNHEPPVEWQRR